MQRSTTHHHVFGSSAAAALVALLAGCAGSQQPSGAPITLPTVDNTATGYTVLHTFGHGADGQNPQAALINVRGTLYGTTYGGGNVYRDGTVFSISTSGTENVVYTFQGGNDGANPSAALLAVNGTLYGTTTHGGGVFNVGSVFKVQTDGSSESVLHAFGQNYDGQLPVASLTALGGKLYGTTSAGGTLGYGTVFRINKQGTEKVLHSFTVYGDGAEPTSSLVDLGGTLYGTTEAGGAASGYAYKSCGTAFSINKAAIESVVYNFSSNCGSGGRPQGALIAVGGTLYGTTADRGLYGGTIGSGTAFSVTPTGSLTILHNFGFGSDGARPLAPLLNVNGTLYGTTSLGGSYNEGTVFKLTLAGKETVLHSFGEGSDGATPFGGLIDVKGTLYGTTSAGGRLGYGTVFALRIKK